MTKLVRKIVGMDKDAAKEVFTEFLSDESLNVSQLKFIELLVDYIVANGFVENNQVLTEDPFRSVGSIIDVFDPQQRIQLVRKINEIRTQMDIA